MLDKIEAAIATITLIELLIIVFGAYSITRLIVTDKMPWVEKPRNWIYDRFPPLGHTTKHKIKTKGVESMNTSGGWYVTQGHWIGELLSCPWCAGFYVSLAVSIAYLYLPIWTLGALFPMALRAGVGVIAYHNGG